MRTEGKHLFRLIHKLFIPAVLFVAGIAAFAAPPDTRTPDVKTVLKEVQQSIVKVTSYSSARTVASGVVIEPEYVISSYRLVLNPYDRITITTVNGDSFPARLIGADGRSKLALLKTEGKKLPPIKPGKLSEIGDWVALVGVFYEKFPAIYQGIVSSANEEQLLLNAPVGPGYAGGAAVNRNGEFAGIILGRFGFTFQADYTVRGRDSELIIQSPRSLNQELSFAIPAPQVLDIVSDLKKYGKVRRGWLGITLRTPSDSNRISVDSVADNSPAQKAGILPGDVILSFQNASVNSGDEVSRLVRRMKPGEMVKIALQRGDNRKSLDIPLAEIDANIQISQAGSGLNMKTAFPEFKDGLPNVNNYMVRIRSSRSIGVDAMELTSTLAKKLNVDKGFGLLVSRVFDGSAAQKTGLQEGDVIVRAANRDIRNNSDLHNLLDELEEGESITMDYYRDGKSRQISLTPDKNSDRIFGQVEQFWESLRSLKDEQTSGKKSAPANKNEKELEAYKKELEQMRKNQQRLMKQMEELEKRLKEKEEKKEAKSDKK